MVSKYTIFQSLDYLFEGLNSLDKSQDDHEAKSASLKQQIDDLFENYLSDSERAEYLAQT